LADTGSKINVISSSKVTELGKTSEVMHLPPDLMPKMAGFQGGLFQPEGLILLCWRSKRHSTLHKQLFWVVKGCPVEMIFSKSYVQELGLVRFNWDAVLVNVFHKQIGTCFF
jgi:hypothetical protein